MGKIQSTFASARKELRKHANPDKAEFLKRFFKTGKGQYAEGDQFIGVVVPTTRAVARLFLDLSLLELQKLMDSPIHEERLLALIILELQYSKGDEKCRAGCFRFYLKNLKNVNNWDLVDSSAACILGVHLMNGVGVSKKKGQQLLDRLSESSELWERRIAMVSTLTWVREGEFFYALRYARRLLGDSEDLIHKASGWVLREVGKKDEKVLRGFLDQHASVMPRTMLRYSLERLEKPLRMKYMKVRQV